MLTACDFVAVTMILASQLPFDLMGVVSASGDLSIAHHFVGTVSPSVCASAIRN
jgi:hypothetical protein